MTQEADPTVNYGVLIKALMTELCRHIGPDVDVPAGDIGVGAEKSAICSVNIRKSKVTLKNEVLTGKGLSYGGSILRPEAGRFCAVYSVMKPLKDNNDSIKGKTFNCPVSETLVMGAAKKIAELGGKAVTIPVLTVIFMMLTELQVKK